MRSPFVWRGASVATTESRMGARPDRSRRSKMEQTDQSPVAGQIGLLGGAAVVVAMAVSVDGAATTGAVLSGTERAFPPPRSQATSSIARSVRERRFNSVRGGRQYLLEHLGRLLHLVHRADRDARVR